MDLHKYVCIRWDTGPATSIFSLLSSLFLLFFSIFNYIKWNRKLQRDSRQRNRNVMIRASWKDSFAIERFLFQNNELCVSPFLEITTDNSFILLIPSIFSREKKKKGNAKVIRFIVNVVIIFTTKTSHWRIDFLAPIYKPIPEQRQQQQPQRSFQRGVFNNIRYYATERAETFLRVCVFPPS